MGGGVLTAIGELVAAAVGAGVELEVLGDGRLRARGQGGAGAELLAELKVRRDEVLEYLTRCCRCRSVHVVLRTWAADEPWCRSCAQTEGARLLAEDQAIPPESAAA